MTEKKDTQATPAGDAAASRTSCPIEVKCPTCGFVAPVTAVRCPRCYALLIAACGGACSSCGSRGCLVPDEDS